MKRLFLLGSLLASCWVLGVAQVAETNQVEGVVAKLDSVQVVVADSAALAWLSPSAEISAETDSACDRLIFPLR